MIMEKLPTETVLQIIETSDFLPELLKYRTISRSFRQLVDDKCKPLAFRLGRQHVQAFDDALLAIRLKRIPLASCCHYDLQRGDYSFYPSKEFLQAVMEGRTVPPGCPNIPPATWYEEVEAVMDLYLLALAWMSTTKYDDGINGAMLWPGGVDLPEVDTEGEWPRPMTEAYFRSTFRIFAFTSLYGPRIFAEPVSAVLAIAVAQDAHLDEPQKYHLIQQETGRYPSLTLCREETQEDVTLYSIFEGFFGWLYAQSEPRDVLPLPRSYYDEEDSDWDMTLRFTEEERQQVALVQLIKIYDIMCDRACGTEPDPNQHVAFLFNPICPHLSEVVTVYRPRLPFDAWAHPQEIINAWAESDTPSLVLQFVATPDYRIRLDHDFFTDILLAQLKNRFRLEHETRSLDLLGIDYGVLDPRSELLDLE
jgi:hypothetical protein